VIFLEKNLKNHCKSVKSVQSVVYKKTKEPLRAYRPKEALFKFKTQIGFKFKIDEYSITWFSYFERKKNQLGLTLALNGS
jgi:hypothetical protein